MIEDGDFAYTPSGGKWKQRLGGIALPLLPISYGFYSLFAKKCFILGRHGTIAFHGNAAIFLALAYLAFGVFLHFHYYWGLHEELCFRTDRMKILTLLVGLPCLVTAVFLKIGQ